MKPRLLSPVKLGKLYAMLVITVLLFLAEIAASHITHSLTLLVDAYHTLYNTLAVLSCIVTLKLCDRPPSLSNTFGWARVEVLAMMADLLFLAALCFSVLVEAIQTMVHADHQDAMHYPIIVGALGLSGCMVNVLCMVLIGGYTHHQGSFLEVDPSGAVVVNGAPPTEDSVRRGMRRLSVSSSARRKGQPAANPSSCPALSSIIRDLTSCALVAIVAGIVWMDEHSDVALYVDPGVAIVSVIILALTSYPYAIQAGCILLQTIPGDIDVDEFKTELTKQFPCLVEVHDLHIWALTPSRTIATAHLIFRDQQTYAKVAPAIEEFFREQDITHITLQPEFPPDGEVHKLIQQCALSCQDPTCVDRLCCKNSPLTSSGSNKDIPEIQIGHSHGTVTCTGNHHHDHHGHNVPSTVSAPSDESKEVEEKLLPSVQA